MSGLRSHTPSDSPPDTRLGGGVRWGRVVLFATVAAALWMLSGIPRQLDREPHFADESFFVAETYYWRLYRGGQWNHPDWLAYPAYDHQPLPRYLFGVALELAGQSVPASASRIMEWYGFRHAAGGQWVRSPSGGDYSPPGPAVLHAARTVSVVFAVAGCWLLFAIGMKIHRWWVGLAAAFVLALDPLYFTLGRRAMSDAMVECFVLASVLCGLWAWEQIFATEFRWRRWLGVVLAGGVLCGLAVLSKLNGTLAALVIAAMMAAGTLLATIRSLRGRGAGAATEAGREPPGTVDTRPAVPVADDPPPLAATSSCVPHRRNLVVALPALAAMGVVALVTLLALNPFLHARPAAGALPTAAVVPEEFNRLHAMRLAERLRFLFQFRLDWAKEEYEHPKFPEDHLGTARERVAAVFHQGLGRYSPFGRRRIVEAREGQRVVYAERSWTAWLFGPLVLWGFIAALRGGLRAYRNGEPPHEWAAALYVAAAVVSVTLYIPLDWDRYYLPIQAPAALMAVYAVGRFIDRIGRRLVLTPPEPSRHG